MPQDAKPEDTGAGSEPPSEDTGAGQEAPSHDTGAGSEAPPHDTDLSYQWGDPRDYRPPEGVMQRVTGSAGGSALGAAMVAIGEILEPEKVRVEIQQEDDEPLDDLPCTLDFGDLPPLD